MKRIAILFLSFLLLASLQAQPTNENASSRPKVGVVLGGGGARGASHIGVLKYIEELGIPVDYVAGTSMGSIIGGLYAMGYDPDEMTQLISNIPWDEYIGNKIDRTTMSAESRQRNSTTMLDIPFSLQSLKNPGQNNSVLGSLPGAYVNNSGLINLFNDLCVGYQEEMDFNDMPIPFACVATDLITGEEVIIRKGVVPQAMRASMAIPGVFSPVVIGDHVMVDGGLVNNFPADVLREMGADIVIGVEVTSEKTWTPEMLRSLPQVMARLITNITNAKRTTNRGLCDVHLTPDIAGFGMLSFTPDAIATLVDRGYRVAQENRDQLMAIKQAVDKAAGHPVGKELHAPRSLNLMEFPITLNDVHIQGTDPKYDRWMIRKSGLKPGGKYSKEDIERAISIYRGTGCFDEITYNLIEAGSGYDLNINMTPATPNVVGLAARYDTEEGAALLFSAGLNEKAFDGHKFSLKAKLSYNPRISAQYTYSRHSLANFNLFYDLRNEHYKDRYNYVDFINFHHYQQRIGASVSQFHLLNLSACAGAYLVSTTYDKLGISGDDFEAYLANNKEFVPFVEVQYDNLDDAYFAKHGLYGKLKGELTYDIDTSLYNSKNVSLAFQSYITPMNGKVTFIPQAYGRYFFGDPQYYNLTNFFGGEIAGRHYEQQLPFIGITYAQDGAPVMGILRCDVRYNFYGKHYLTAMYNVLVEKYSTFNYYTHGAGLKYSFNSPLGPISLTGQWETLTHKFNAYFSFGYTF